MRRSIEKLLRRWGNTLQMVTPSGVTALRGILQPTFSKSLANMRKTVDMEGQKPMGQFLYLGMTDLSSADYLLQEDTVYLVRSCEAVRVADRVLFYWALLVKAGEEDVWTK